MGPTSSTPAALAGYPIVSVPAGFAFGRPVGISFWDEHTQHCIQALYHLTKALDLTRPVVGNDVWESAETDIMASMTLTKGPEFQRFEAKRRQRKSSQKSVGETTVPA